MGTSLEPIVKILTIFLSVSVVSINQVNVGSTFTWALITRRSVHRAGTRLFCRGIDKDVSIDIKTT